LEQPMPTQRRSQPAGRTAKKMAGNPQSKRSAATKPTRAGTQAKPKKPAKPAKPAKPIKAKSTGPARSTKPAKLAKPGKHPKPAPSKRAPATPTQRPPAKPPSGKAAPAFGPSSHEQAVEAFEHGFQALQQRQFAKAAEFLTTVVNNFSDEKDLQERARVYLAICERQAARETKPRSFDDRLHAATVIVNRGAFDEALGQLRKLENDDAGNDYVQYLLSVVYTATGNAEQALAHLRKAIELAPENRFRAAQDPDLELLRQNAAFAELAGELPRRRRPVAKKR
jgi:hypothetical protein